MLVVAGAGEHPPPRGPTGPLSQAGLSGRSRSFERTRLSNCLPRLLRPLVPAPLLDAEYGRSRRATLPAAAYVLAQDAVLLPPSDLPAGGTCVFPRSRLPLGHRRLSARDQERPDWRAPSSVRPRSRAPVPWLEPKTEAPWAAAANAIEPIQRWKSGLTWPPTLASIRQLAEHPHPPPPTPAPGRPVRARRPSSRTARFLSLFPLARPRRITR